MIEQLLGTTCLCAIITLFSYFAFYRIACMLKIKNRNNTKINFEEYATHIFVFLAISSIILLFIIRFHTSISSRLPIFLNDSGFTFFTLQLMSGALIRWLYIFIFFCINKIVKSDSSYRLTNSELSCTWLLLCFIYGVVFLFYKEYTIAFMYFVIDLSYFFWLDSNTSSISEKITNLKKISKSFWYVIIFSGLTAFISIRYTSTSQTLFAFAGLFIGIIICIYAINHYKKF